ncbi:MAG: MerR family transcriptional regulator [Patescibacteria group bacterium]|jgi:hypothetical protein
MPYKFDINETADILGVNPYTLRRWDNKKILKANRDSEKGHRYYFEDDIEIFLSNNYKYLLKIANKWSLSKESIKIPSRFYCEDAFVFKSRLSRFAETLKRDGVLGDSFSLVTSVVGEIGNNSFDHNIGNWPDIPGIFFGYSLKERKIILADRGRGVLTTLQKIRPELANDKDALKIAFTEVVTGRYPENRGNGLKYVKKIVQNNNMFLWFHSGQNAIVLKSKSSDLINIDLEKYMRGCFVILEY